MNTALNRSMVALLTNKSGGSVAQGDVVIVDSANASAFTTTTTSAYVSGSVGVVLEPNGIASNAIGLIAFGGYVPIVNLSGSASLGDVFKTHSVAKQAVRHAGPIVAGDFGQVWGTGTTPAALLWGVPQGGGGGTSGPAGKLGYAQITATISTASTTAVDATGLTVTVTIGSRPVKVTVWGQEFSNNTGTNRTIVNIFDTTAGVIVATGVLAPSAASAGVPLSVMAANLSPAAGSRSYKAQYYAIDGGSSQIQASATSPAFILVEEI